MKPTERKSFVRCLAALAAAFSREATEPLYEAYWLGLKDLPLKAVETAVAVAIRDEKFMPQPAVLRELAGVLRPEDRAVKAWGAVQAALKQHDYYDSVVFDDPLTTATVRHLWHTWMGMSDTSEKEDEKWLRKEFERVYCALARTGISRIGTLPLLGYYEQQNHLHGYGYGSNQAVLIPCGLPALPQLTRSHEKPTRRLARNINLLENIGNMPQGS